MKWTIILLLLPAACANSTMHNTTSTATSRTTAQHMAQVMDEISPQHLRHTVDTLASFGTRHTASDTESQTRGIGAARRWIKATLEESATRADHMTVRFDAHSIPPGSRRLPDGAQVVNVIAEIRGTMPEAAGRHYYVLGHNDSRNSDGADFTNDAPGANDDASGVAVLMELARVLADKPLESTVILMATAGEEQGLYGAREHAQKAVAAGVDIRGVLNNDTVGDPTGPGGRSGRNEIRVFSEGLPASAFATDDQRSDADRLRMLRTMRTLGAENDSPSRQLARTIADVARAHNTRVQPRLITRADRFLRGGDHTPFNELGLPAIRFCETYEDYNRQHQDVRIENGIQYGDLPEFVDEHYLADVTRLNAAVLITLANAPSVPADARIIAAELTNDTTLRWSPCPEPDVAGYEVVWRNPTSFAWQHARDVGNVTQATIDLSKDNFFFGVRAYDHDGYRSPVAFPVASRD